MNSIIQEDVENLDVSISVNTFLCTHLDSNNVMYFVGFLLLWFTLMYYGVFLPGKQMTILFVYPRKKQIMTVLY